MKEIEIEINNERREQVIIVGNEKTPVFIVDNFFVDLESTLDFAKSQAEFVLETKTFYPGVRASLPGEYSLRVLSYVQSILLEHYNVPAALTFTPDHSCYSLITKSEHELHPFQCLPHFDSLNRHYFAVMHCLNAGGFGGTSLYRHNPSGFERITQERKDQYFSQAEAFINNNGGLPVQEYYKASDGHYQEIERIAYKQNRLIIYPGSLLHCPAVNIEQDLNSDPVTGRLTANLFIDFE